MEKEKPKKSSTKGWIKFALILGALILVGNLLEAATGPGNPFNVVFIILTLALIGFIAWSYRKNNAKKKDDGHESHGDDHGAVHPEVPKEKTAWAPRILILLFVLWLAYQWADWHYNLFGSVTLEWNQPLLWDMEPNQETPVVNIRQSVSWESHISTDARLYVKKYWWQAWWVEYHDGPNVHLDDFSPGHNRKMYWVSPTYCRVVITGMTPRYQ